MKLISAICPSKRSIADLQLTIDNFLEQTYPCKELVILRTEVEADWWMISNRHSNIKVHVVPAGLSIGELRNIACRLSRGSVIAHVDDDDTSHPERLARSMAAIDAGAQLVGSSRVVYERSGYGKRAVGMGPVSERWLFDGNALKPKYLVGGTLVYHRSQWEQFNFQDVAQGEDTLWQMGWRRTLYNTPAAAATEWPRFWVDLADETLYTARMSDDNTSKKDPESPGWSRIS